MSKLTELHARQQPAKRMVALHLALECYFGAGKKAHRHIRFSDGSKPSREEIELVTSLSPTFAGRDATL